MRTLYVSDLDGTLLNSASRLDAETISIINRLVDEGVLFTYATARSLSSASVATRGLTTRIPVIAYNGAFIFDPSDGSVLASEGFTPAERADVRAALEALHISPVVYSFVNGVEKVSWDTRKLNDGKRRYFDSRRGDRRLRPLPDDAGLYDGGVFYYTTIGEREELQPLYDRFAADERYTCTLQQELYRPEYWCEIMPRRATKSNAMLKLKSLWHCGRVVSFGDQINDIPMFRVSDECYAVANAVEGLKREATGVIGDNDHGSVAHWLLEHAERCGGD